MLETTTGEVAFCFLLEMFGDVGDLEGTTEEKADILVVREEDVDSEEIEAAVDVLGRLNTPDSFLDCPPKDSFGYLGVLTGSTAAMWMAGRRLTATGRCGCEEALGSGGEGKDIHSQPI